MFRKALALFLCIACLGSVCFGLTSCKEKDEDDKGAIVTVYVPDTVIDLDPANAFYNDDVARIVNLVFDTLFYVDSKGNLQNGLAQSYKIFEDKARDEYYMEITLKKTLWTDKTPLTADDVIFAWKRILDYENNNPAASLLFDIKGARAFNVGEVGPDDIGLDAIDDTVLKVTFETAINYKNFLMNLTNVCTAPLREDYCGRLGDWAKKSSTMVASGPYKLTKVYLSDPYGGKIPDHYYLDDVNFKLGVKEGEYIEKSLDDNTRKDLYMFVLERNQYYFRDPERDPLEKIVKPFKLIVMCGLSAEEVDSLYKSGDLFYVGHIPMSIREDYAGEAVVSDALSTLSLSLNENREFNGVQLFADPNVRKALSLAIDREALAKQAVFAKPATGIVPPGVFNADSAKETFRSAGEDLIATTANMTEAKRLLSEAGITPSDYSFQIMVSVHNDVHMAMAEKIKDAWVELGFDVTLQEKVTITNNDYYKYTASVPLDVIDDMYMDSIVHGDYDVAIFDMSAYSVNAFGVLAQFATTFSGMAVDIYEDEDSRSATHVTGYSNEDYDQLIEDAFAEKDVAKRAVILHEAEKILAEDLPVIPVLFNQKAELVNSKVLRKYSADYYLLPVFTNCVVPDYFSYYEDFNELISVGLKPWLETK